MIRLKAVSKIYDTGKYGSHTAVEDATLTVLERRFTVLEGPSGSGKTTLLSLIGWISCLFFIVAILSVISFISLYYYALPTHHCPFDLLQAHYHYIGYPLYAAIFITAVSGMGVGVLDRFESVDSLSTIVPALQRRYAYISLGPNLLTTAIAAYPMIFSDFRLVYM